jgi:hypothetical protein
MLSSWKSIISGVLALIERLLLVYVKTDRQLVVKQVICILLLVGNPINSDQRQ